MSTKNKNITKDDGLTAIKLGLFTLIQDGLSINEIIEESNTIFQHLLESENVKLFSINNLGIVKQEHISKVGDFVFDSLRRTVTYKGESVDLTPADATLLGLFLDNPGKVISHDEIVSHVSKYEDLMGEPSDTARPMISRLRSKLSTFPEGEHWIETIRGNGYVFNGI